MSQQQLIIAILYYIQVACSDGGCLGGYVAFGIEFDTNSIEEAMNEIKDIVENKLQDAYIQALADQLLSNIYKLINEGEWETVTGGPTYGIVDSGEYKGSWETYYDELKKIMHVGSLDPKAPLIEDGSTPEDNVGLKDETIINWARRNQIKNAERVGVIIARAIRKLGTPPKPVLRQALAMLNSQAETIKKEVIAQFDNL